MRPSVESLPVVGFSPNVPHMDAGMRIEPPVSEPSAQGMMPAATAAPEPPLEPPVILVRSQGLYVGPIAETALVPPAASSCWFVFPRMMTPARRRAAMVGASFAATFPANAAEQALVSCPATSKRSLTATGTPAKGLREDRALSIRLASA